MKNLVLVTLLSLLAFSCASYQPGNYANIVKGDHPKNLPIAAEIDKDLSTTHYTVIKFTFGNQTPDWRRVEKVKLDLSKPSLNENAEIVMGSDIKSWSDAIKYKMKVDKYNQNLVYASIAAAGGAAAGVGSATGNENLARAGALTALGTVTVAQVNAFLDKKSEVERGKIFPETHLYHPFAIPAGLVTNRWVLLKIQYDQMPRSIYFDVNYKSGEEVTYKIELSPKKHLL